MLHRVKSATLPTDADLIALPRATAGEFELSDAEVKRLRSRIYGLNRDNARYTFRTLRAGTLLLVWRIS